MLTTQKIALFGGAVLVSATAVFVLLNPLQPALPTPAITQATPASPSLGEARRTQPAAVKPAGAAIAPPADAEAALSEAQLLRLADSNPDYATLADRVGEVSARRNGQAVDVAALYAATQQKSAWKALDGVPEGFPLSVSEQYDGRQFIEINPMKIESLLPGDTLDIDIGQLNQSFTAVIDNVQAQPGNNVTWTGHLQNQETESQVVFTRGESLIVAGITTPQGHFEMEARGDKGWIVSSATLFKTPDVLLEVPADELAKTPATLPPVVEQEQVL
ncbi:MAG: hypothetical protein ABWY06_11325 [Pseudomonas sp.]|uniref:hypothetical protein n=1 Tax=Pseudomonas sp. TaxID=306 RepID=UPI0033970E0E